MAMERTTTRAHKQAQPVLAAAAVAATASPERPLKDLDRPTFLRRMNDARESLERGGLSVEDEWDVPTFLRKQVD
jgi:cell division protein FtsZ